MDIFQATQRLQECVNELQKEGFALDVKVGIKPLQKQEKPKTKFLIKKI
jgi:hypothetical protein